MAEDYVSEDDIQDEPSSKRRKTGDESYVDVNDQDRDDEEGEEEEEEEVEDDEFDGFIVNEDEVEENRRRRKRKRRKKKKRKKHRSAAPITEDTLRMIAEQQGTRHSHTRNQARAHAQLNETTKARHIARISTSIRVYLMIPMSAATASAIQNPRHLFASCVHLAV